MLLLRLDESCLHTWGQNCCECQASSGNDEPASMWQRDTVGQPKHKQKKPRDVPAVRRGTWKTRVTPLILCRAWVSSLSSGWRPDRGMAIGLEDAHSAGNEQGPPDIDGICFYDVLRGT